MKVILFRKPLNFLQSSGDPDGFALLYRVFHFVIDCFKFFVSQGRFLRLGKVPLGIQISMIDMKVFPRFAAFGLHQRCPTVVPN